MSVKITYFVHGTTTDNEKGLATGWAHGELSETGKQQARELGRLVSDKKFDIVFCSDLQRALASARLAFTDKYVIVPDDRLREVNYGDYTQAAACRFKADETEWIDKKFPGGESYKDVGIRIDSFCKFLKENYDGQHVAIVAHQAPQFALEVALKGKTWEQAIQEDWRKQKAWQPGWEYEIK